jgi:trans-aconitate methyltransferase
MSIQPPSTRWDSALYDDKHRFISTFGEEMLGLLAPQAGERILDLGCGTGHLTQKIASYGAIVTGIDSALTMIEQARHNYPELDFRVANGESFEFDETFDAVFSNAALHWMTNADAVVRRIARALKPGGRLVAEMGGKTNIHHIYTALLQSFEAIGYPPPQASPWYFPSIGEYASLLEKHEFFVTYATHFSRFTPLDGENGMRNWLVMFANSFLKDLPPQAQDALATDMENRLRPVLYQDGRWVADYVRLRIIAIKREL